MKRVRNPASQHSELDPQDWSEFRELAHEVLDACIDHLEDARNRPWKPFPREDREAMQLGTAAEGTGIAAVAKDLVERVLPYSSGGTHPSFFGWVQGTGNVAGLLAEIVAATMNSNCGGRNHAALYIERDVIAWCRERFGFPESAGGVLVVGTSQATVLALAVARQAALGKDSRQTGILGSAPLACYAAEGVHQAVTKAIELIGLGTDTIRLIPRDPLTGAMRVDAVREQIARDRAAGVRPFCLAATAGSVDTGSFDPLGDLADLCAAEDIWLHVDGAFGAWLKLADPPWKQLVEGMERADSIALDFHKWMFVQYDCGLVLVRDGEAQRATFSSSAPYLKPADEWLGGGGPWFGDYGIDLSRGFRALKAWATIRAYGSDTLGRVITDNCRFAQRMGELIQRSEQLELIFPVISNVCCFSVRSRSQVTDETDLLNRDLVSHFQRLGEPIFSLTNIGGRTVVRAAIVNHRTTSDDIETAIAKLEAFCRQLPQR